MMLNAMAPQSHHEQSGGPLLLTNTSSPACSSSVATTISTSPSSSSSVSSSHQSQHNHRDNSRTTTTTAKSTTIPTQTTTTTTANAAPSSGTTTTNSSKTQTTTTNSHSSVHHHHNNNNHQQHHHHFHNNSYQPTRFNNNHHYHNSHNHHHHKSSYASRSSNNLRGHSSNHNHNHSHNHQNHHQHGQQQQHLSDTNIPVTSSTASSLPLSGEVTLTTSTVANHRQQQQQQNGPPHYVDLHVNVGECVSLQLLDGQEQVVAGPATITMISQQQNPPVPVPVQVPPGHMIHQIADENGTLKHIILSVMDTNDDGTQLDSTVITLPQGTFRIDSHGELVSTNGNGSDVAPLTTLSQQAYFANYDGCPVATYDATTLPDSIETTPTTTSITPTATTEVETIPVVAGEAQTPSSANYNQGHQQQQAIKITNDKSEEVEHPLSEYDKSNTRSTNTPTTDNQRKQREPIIHSKVDSSSNGGDSSSSMKVDSNETLASKQKHKHSSVTSVNSSQTNSNSAISFLPNEFQPKEETGVSEMMVSVVSSSAEAKQMVVPTSSIVSDTVTAAAPPQPPPYNTAHQIMGEIELMNGAMGPTMLSTVDGQIYGYPACCCCCYCDPQEATSGGQPLPPPSTQTTTTTTPMGLPGQDPIIGLAEHANNVPGSSRMPPSRGSASNLSHTNGGSVIAYPCPGPPPPQMIVPPMAANIGLPIGVQQPPLPPSLPVTAGLPVQPIESQNGVPAAAGHMVDSGTAGVTKLHQGGGHSGKGVRGGQVSNGYKQQQQHKMVSGPHSSGNLAPGDRSGYSNNHYSNQNHQSYNNIVSGHHHHHHQQQQQQQQPSQQHYKQHAQPTDVSNSSSSSFKLSSQALLSKQGTLGVTGNYSPVYSNYNHVPTASLSSVVSSSCKTVQEHQQQQQSAATYRTPETGDSYTQRTREQASYSQTNNSYNGPANVRSQYNNEHKRQSHSDKTTTTSHQHNKHTAAAAASVKVISNNNPPLANNLTSHHHHQAGSVSPIRSRMKGSSMASLQHNNNNNHHHQQQHHNHHHQQASNGIRQLNQHHNSPVTGQLPPSIHHQQANFQVSRDLASLNHIVKSTKNIQAHDHHPTGPAAVFKHQQHINNAAHPSLKGAWQSGAGNKINQQQCKNIGSDTEVLDESSVRYPQAAGGGLVSITTTIASKQQHGGIRGVKDSNEALDEHNQALNDDNTTNDSAVVGKSPESSSMTNDELDSRRSRGKQNECRNQHQTKNQSSDRHKRHLLANDTNRNVRSGFLSEASSTHRSIDNDDKVFTANDKTTTRPDSKSRRTRDSNSLKQQQGKGISKRAAAHREKSLSQPSGSAEVCQMVKSGTNECKVINTAAEEATISGESTISVIIDDMDNKASSCELFSAATKEIGRKNEMSSPVISSSKSTTSSKPSNESPKHSDTIDQAADSHPSQQLKHKNKHNSNQQSLTLITGQHQSKSRQQQTTATKNDSSLPARSNGSKKVLNDDTKAVPSLSSKLCPPDSNQSGTTDRDSSPTSRINELETHSSEELDEGVVSLTKTMAGSSSLKDNHNQPSITITMRTSLSENNIRAYEASSCNSSSVMKSTQTTPQKVVSASLTDTSVTTTTSAIQLGTSDGSESSRGKKGEKGRGTNAKNEKQVKISSLPQLQLLNLNCTSVTSSSVQLRWSYIPSLADKYSIPHQHHQGKNSVVNDHFVVECSNNKNVESNTLILPKSVYQGCAQTCRINHLSSEKIYHFKVRRTALVTANKHSESVSEKVAGKGEHLVVSDILSVTLPNVHQAQQHSGKKGSSGGRYRNPMDAVTSSDFNQGEAAHLMVTSVTASSAASNAYRGNTSSHSNSNHSSNSKTVSHPIKFSNLFRQCRTKFVTMLGKLVQNSLSSYSDAKFAGLLLVLFTVFAMLLAIFIHLYIVAPVTE